MDHFTFLQYTFNFNNRICGRRWTLSNFTWLFNLKNSKHIKWPGRRHYDWCWRVVRAQGWKLQSGVRLWVYVRSDTYNQVSYSPCALVFSSIMEMMIQQYNLHPIVSWGLKNWINMKFLKSFSHLVNITHELAKIIANKIQWFKNIIYSF